MNRVTEVKAVPVPVHDIEVQIAQALAMFDPVAVGIDELRSRAQSLSIDGPDDLEGHASVRAARLEAKALRVAVEKRRKELKADSLRFGRAVDARAKEITDPILAIEAPLDEQEKAFAAERAAIKAEKEAAEKAVLDDRVAALQAVGASVMVSTVAGWDGDEYAKMLEEFTARHEAAEAERLEREQKVAQERAAAEAKAKAERAAAQAERAAAQAERCKLDAERRELEQEAEAKAKAERVAVLAEIAEERKAFEAERIAFEAQRAAAQAERERAEQERRAAELQAQRDAELVAKRESELAAARAKKAKFSRWGDHPYYQQARRLGAQIEDPGPSIEGAGDDWTHSLRAACKAASRHLYELGQDVLDGKFDGGAA